MHIGEPVTVCGNDDKVILSGIITALGTEHAVVNDSSTGENYNIALGMLRTGSLIREATATVLKDDTKEGKKFELVKNEENKDGKISIKYTITNDSKPVWESEEIITNVYDYEQGWSIPDDFDENKIELIENKADAGFDLIVESYETMKQTIQNENAAPTETDKVKDVPAFAPGTKPKEEVPEGSNLMGENAPPTGEEPVAETPIEEAPAELAPNEGEVTTSLKRSIIGSKGNELHNNPEHRLNPALRQEMDRKNIDSGNTNDLELAEKLKDFDYKLSSIENKIKNL